MVLTSTMNVVVYCRFFSRWKEYEMLQASMLHFTLEEAQWQEDWSNLLSLASQPGSSLEQLHIFALAHILRRPIVVYGVKYVKSFRGEDIGYARFEGNFNMYYRNAFESYYNLMQCIVQFLHLKKLFFYWKMDCISLYVK